MADESSKSLTELFAHVKNSLPEKFKTDAWYLIVASVLIGCGKPSEVGPLYASLVEGADETEEQRIKNRLSDVLMKEWTLVGVPLCVYAVTALAKAETERRERLGFKTEGPPGSSSTVIPEHRQNLDINNAIPERGTAFMQRLYQENLAPIKAAWGSYGDDFMWMERAVIYGLFLSDHSVLSDVESELVILSSIMIQGLSAPTMWHLRGLRRLGISEEDTELVQQAIEAVATWAGKSVQGWPRVKDIPDKV